MTDKEALLEKAAEAVHDAWVAQKRADGFHHPNECLVDGARSPIVEVGNGPVCRLSCLKCHADLVPYGELSEAKKEYDRVTVRVAAAPYLARLDEVEAYGREYVELTDRQHDDLAQQNALLTDENEALVTRVRELEVENARLRALADDPRAVEAAKDALIDELAAREAGDPMDVRQILRAAVDARIESIRARRPA